MNPELHEERRSRRASLAAQVAAGESVQDVAKKNSVSMSVVYGACRESGVVYGNAHGNWYTILKYLFDPQMTFSVIAQKLNITKQRVSSIYRRAREVEIPGLPERWPNKPDESQGESLKEIHEDRTRGHGHRKNSGG